MTTVTVPETATESSPGWARYLLAWRYVTVAILVSSLVAVLVQRVVVTDGPVRWALAAALAGASVGAVFAARWTSAADHRGRLSGFGIDLLLAVVAGFLALNRMGMFTGLDTVGEAFNGSIGWLAIIIIGWVAQGFAPRVGAGQEALKRVARWTMLAGLAILLFSIGLIPGLIEFFVRAVDPDVIYLWVMALAAAASARLLWTDSAAHHFASTESQIETMDGLFFRRPQPDRFSHVLCGTADCFPVHQLHRMGWANPGEVRRIAELHRSLLGRSVSTFASQHHRFRRNGHSVGGRSCAPFGRATQLEPAGMKFFRAIYFLPSIAGVVGVTLIWKQLFNSTVGYLNFMILKATEWLSVLPEST